MKQTTPVSVASQHLTLPLDDAWSEEGDELEAFGTKKKSASLFSLLFGGVVSLVVLLLISPLFLVLLVVVRLQSPRVFDKVKRNSYGSKKLEVLNFCCSVLVDGKPKTTSIGRILRRTGADQLPMLISVFRGDISLREAFQIAVPQPNDLSGEGAYHFGDSIAKSSDGVVIGGNKLFWITKRIFDVVMSFTLLSIMGIVALALLVLNPFWNKGPLFFVQKRMGKDCVPFAAIKFRTMTEKAFIERGPDDPVEVHRITKLGGCLRKLRLDELPQIINVLMGQMSLIGPRPDYFEHAASFVVSVPDYRARHCVRPGISGLAQVHLGYVVGVGATQKKVHVDHIYIANAGFAQEISIFLQTIVTIFYRVGS